MKIGNMRRISRVLVHLEKDLLVDWNRIFVGKKGKEAWRITSLCLFLDNLKGTQLNSL